MIVGFFRHGPAEEGSSDERPLSAEGREKTEQAARGLRTLDLGIAAVYTSPLPRAVETAEIVARALELPRPKILEALRPAAPAKGLLPALRGRAPLVVGHEPLLSSAVSLAIGAAAGAVVLKKAGLAVVEFGAGLRSRGMLKLLLSPSALRRLRR